MATDKELEYEFIVESLDVWADVWVIPELEDAIDRLNLKNTGDLRTSFSSKVVRGVNPKLELTFLSYGRAIEIAYHKKRSKNTSKFLREQTNKSLWGVKSKSKSKKDTRWYSKNVYGSLNRLIGKLMYEYDDVALERMKNILSKAKIV